MTQALTHASRGLPAAGAGSDAAQELLGRTVGAVVFDWDGTAVPDRRASARAVRSRLEKLSALGIHTAVVSGTHLANIDGHLQARPPGPGRLLLGLNRGSELFEVTAAGPTLLERRDETPELTQRLDRVAAAVTTRLRAAGLHVEVVSSRLNRRKIDLVPEPDWADPPKTRIAELVAAVTERLRRAGFESIGEVAALATAVAVEEGLADARVTSDAKHIEIGVTDKSDSMRAILGHLDRLGISGELVLVVGDEFGELGGLPGSDALLVLPDRRESIAVSVGVEPVGVPEGVRHFGGGPATFLALLDEQLLRTARLRVPEICEDPRWTIVERGVDVTRHRVTESLFTVTSGGVGFRGSVEEAAGFGHPLLVAAGVYSGPAVTDGLLHGPDVVDVRLRPPVTEDVRVLDLRTGVLHRAEVSSDGDPVRSLRFGSIVEPGVLAMRIEASTGRIHTPPTDGSDEWSAVTSRSGGLGALAHQDSRRSAGVRSVQRIVAVDGSPTGPPRVATARRRLARATATGFERLLAEQRFTWAGRWERVDVRIPEDPETELGLRFALFHLWGLSVEGRELAVGARALTGSGYSGHVFWDADVFVLPALCTIDPPAAGAMVDYRLNRLAAARERAMAEGKDGARFPWESAYDGRDVTPQAGYVGGEQVPILTGTLEEHITADVAWAMVHHATWTRPAARLTREESVLLRDTARYWASRITTDEDGSAHIRGVIGPDEYHERVDDNGYTNAMARWNLRTAVDHAPVRETERAAWSRLAEALVDGYDVASGLYEQFQGYFDLQPLLVREVAEPPVAADVLVGREVIAGSQLIKQPDALMIHHLLPEDAVRGSLRHNLDFYAPRTAHGSSLSPAVMALLHARAGQPDTALDLLRLSLRIDLDDLGGTTSAGVHIGACGGAWQAVVAGFLGARVSQGRLRLDPVVPDRWPDLEVRFRCLGRDVRVRVNHNQMMVDASAPLTVLLSPDCRYQTLTCTGVRFIPGGSL